MGCRLDNRQAPSEGAVMKTKKVFFNAAVLSIVTTLSRGVTPPPPMMPIAPPPADYTADYTPAAVGLAPQFQQMLDAQEAFEAGQGAVQAGADPRLLATEQLTQKAEAIRATQEQSVGVTSMPEVQAKKAAALDFMNKVFTRFSSAENFVHTAIGQTNCQTCMGNDLFNGATQLYDTIAKYQEMAVRDIEKAVAEHQIRPTNEYGLLLVELDAALHKAKEIMWPQRREATHRSATCSACRTQIKEPINDACLIVELE